MICPRCGNEVSQEEAFCGQCGTPNTPPAKPAATLNTHSLGGGQPNTYNPPAPFTPAQPNVNTFNPGTNYTQRTNMPTSQAPYAPDQPPIRPSGPNQGTGFYQDATEAITSLPARPGPAGPGYPTGYLQQGGYAGPQQSGNYRQAVQTPPFPTRQGYPYGGHGSATPPPRQPNSQAVLVISICVVVVLFSIIGIATLLIVRSQQAAQANLAATPSVVATATAVPSPTATPSPTPSPTPTTPPVTPTPAPDAGFTWCSTVCAPYGFSTEYPANWQAGPASNGAGVMFTYPAQGDIYTAIKAPGATTASANDLITSDLQTNYATKPNYTPPANTSTATISGETWLAEVAYYQTDTVRERVVVYATVHQGKAYIIELEAPDTQFDSINAQFFGNILTKFQFVQATS